MATIRQKASGHWEVFIRRKGLKSYYATYTTESQARTDAKRIESLLDQGLIPQELLIAPKEHTLHGYIAEYLRDHPVPDSDRAILQALQSGMQDFLISTLTPAWGLSWVQALKRERKVAPGTIRHQVGALARCLDWHVQLGKLEVNTLRLLPKRYSLYAPGDGDSRQDVERDRRLEEGELDAIMATLRSGVLKGQDTDAWVCLVIMATETAMRLREMYTLTWDQIDTAKRTVFLLKTKNGDKRQVPLSSVALAALSAYRGDEEKHPDGLVFPWWNGARDSLPKTTSRLSVKWGRIARLSGCADLHFHDLRHHATCQFFLRTQLSPLEISLITGHRDMRTLRRYANLRGSELAAAMW